MFTRIKPLLGPNPILNEFNILRIEYVSDQPCLVPELRGKAFNLPLLSMTLAVWFVFIILRYVLSIPTLLRLFITKGCCIMSNLWRRSHELFKSFVLLMWCITEICMSKHPHSLAAGPSHTNVRIIAACA